MTSKINNVMAQQTAVEWLEQQFLLHTKIENSKYVQQEIIDVAMWQFNKYLKQAKQMEKEQTIEDFINGSQWSIFPDDTPINKIAEQYYNKTYNK